MQQLPSHSVALTEPDWGLVLDALREKGGTEERRLVDEIRRQIPSFENPPPQQQTNDGGG